MNCAGGWHAYFCAERTGGDHASGSRYRHRPNPSSATICCSTSYFHGETGAGLGASHQTGWTGLIALLLHPRDAKNPCLLDIASLRTAA